MSTTGSAANGVGECTTVIFVMDEIFRRYSKNRGMGKHLLRSDGNGGLDQVEHCSQSPL